MGRIGAYIVGQFNSCKGKDYHRKGKRREGTFSDAAFSGLAISYTLGRIPVNMPGAIVSGDGAFARRLYRRTPEQAD